MVPCLQRGTLAGAGNCVRGVALVTRSTVLARRLVWQRGAPVGADDCVRGAVLVTRSAVWAWRLVWRSACSVAGLQALAIACAA